MKTKIKIINKFKKMNKKKIKKHKYRLNKKLSLLPNLNNNKIHKILYKNKGLILKKKCNKISIKLNNKKKMLKMILHQKHLKIQLYN